MGETYRLEYENNHRDEFPRLGQGYLQIPTIRVIPPDLGLDERRLPSFMIIVREKFLILKRWIYYLVYSTLSWFSNSFSGERNGDQIYRLFVYGQLISVISAAIWWGFFGTVITFMMESDLAAGNARLVFNLMLVIMSPVSRVISEKISMRIILVYVTMLRSFIWCSYLPFVYVVGRYFGYKSILEIIGNTQFYILIALDGALISLLNVVDLDCGGLNYLSNQYDIEITATQKSQAVYTHLTIFDVSFIVLNPILAFSILSLVIFRNSKQGINIVFSNQELTKYDNFDLSNSGIEIPILIIISVFQALSTTSIFFYKFGIPISKESSLTTSEDSGEYYMNVNQERAQKAFEYERSVANPSHKFSIKEIQNEISNFLEGFVFVSQDINIRNRIFCLAFETAFEDVMISIIIPLTIIHLSKELVEKIYLETQNLEDYWASISLFLVAITLGFGKLSSFIVTWKYQKEYIQNREFEVNANNDFEYNFSTNNRTISSEFTPPSTDISYSKFITQFLNESNLNHLFLQISIADLSVILLPVSISIMKIYSEFFFMQITCICAIFVFSAIFFGCYSVPKIGLSIIYQLFTDDEKKQGKISAFSGIIVTVVDGLVISFISLILHITNNFFGSFNAGLYVISIIYILHAVIEWRYATKYRIDCLTINPDLEHKKNGNISISSV
ncbi:uncharacterized protein cubi_03165 [Cryptosporidium ubiquitum]|uniref:Uncharacterized protein n=1 Tax=Cryptosporidium ubiquitum TaxID=857276 RepID=A0A1J4MLY1_9CRYT|nr:uncharacterized protein cubi_03165 [Cryptosporidium ubiquitum]OII75055.1 hypothetical protein cubi_03165 [Cryptosporidium ubiquitum]